MKKSQGLIRKVNKMRQLVELGSVEESGGGFGLFEVRFEGNKFELVISGGLRSKIQFYFKMISWTKVLILVLAAHMALSIALEESHDIRHEFCWKDSYGRGVGKIPKHCKNRDRIGLLCYDRCPRGFKRWGFDCHQNCPSGWRNDGLFCRHAEYWRGGFPWKWSDGFSSKGMYRRCEAKHGRGRCEKWGAIVYPKCKSGYHNIACCICRPRVPNCKSLGMNRGIDLSCAKKIKIGNPHVADCDSGWQRQAGLCYRQCKNGYYGVGPVCWSSTPQGWVGCGMGAAADSASCRDAVIDQVSSVGTLALNIATLGSSSGATKAATGAKSAAKLSKLRKQLAQIKKSFKASKDMKKLVKKAKNIKRGTEKAQGYLEKAREVVDVAQQVDSADPNKMTAADIIRLTAEIAAIADPTGIASTVAAYSHPKCSQILGEIKQSNKEDDCDCDDDDDECWDECEE